MRRRTDRLVVDTNLWISYLITKDFKSLDEAIKSGKVKLLFSAELLDEFLTVAARPKFRKFFNKKELEELLNLFETYGELVDVNSKVKVCRDPKDNFILALIKDSGADYLLTGDHDLLELGRFAGTKIYNITDYLKLLS